MSPSPKLRHQRIVENVYRLLDVFVRQHRLGEVHIAPLDVHLPTQDVVQPDVIFVAESNRNILQDWIRGVPDLLVEVISSDRVERDRIIKRRIYAQNGVKEYWIVEEPGVEVLTLDGAEYAPFGYFQGQDRLTSPLLPGLEIPVQRIFE